METKIAVIGLGYVGLPLALALARKFKGTVGFDIDVKKVQSLRDGIDVNDEGHDAELQRTSLKMTAEIGDLKGCNFFIVGVPTPVDQNNTPDLSPVRGACEVVGKAISRGSIVVFESTVYPGVTEDLCGPWIEQISGLKRGVGFKLGYSPERINPGDREHSLERVIKVVSGEDAETLELVASIYSSVVEAGVHRAPSIKVAEAAKVIENTQRDLNIALMNELAIIFDRMDIATRDVLSAAGSKWNFLKFTPGLVGGHCIGVDPYYLTTKAQQLGYHPQVILAGRRINDGMGSWIAQKMVKLLVTSGFQVKGARVGVLGITFKENVSDVRNSRVPDIVRELKEFGALPLIHDPHADPTHVKHEYDLVLNRLDEFQRLDGMILAVSHKEYLTKAPHEICSMLNPGGIIVDVKACMDRAAIPREVTYWSL